MPKCFLQLKVIQVIQHPDGEAVGLRGMERVAEVVPVIIRHSLVLGADDIFPDSAQLAARGKVPDELEVGRKGIEIDVMVMIVITWVQCAVAIKGIEFKVFGFRPVMPGP